MLLSLLILGLFLGFMCPPQLNPKRKEKDGEEAAVPDWLYINSHQSHASSGHFFMVYHLEIWIHIWNCHYQPRHLKWLFYLPQLSWHWAPPQQLDQTTLHLDDHIGPLSVYLGERVVQEQTKTRVGQSGRTRTTGLLHGWAGLVLPFCSVCTDTVVRRSPAWFRRWQVNSDLQQRGES